MLVAFVTTDINLRTFGDALSLFTDADIHGRLFAASANIFQLFDGVRQCHQISGTGKWFAEKIAACDEILSIARFKLAEATSTSSLLIKLLVELAIPISPFAV